jgi:hypothetical protein
LEERFRGEKTTRSGAESLNMSKFDPLFNPSAAILAEIDKYGDINPAIKNKGVVRDPDLLGLLASGDEEYVSRARNQELVTAGTGTKKLEKQLAAIRAQLRARDEIVGGEDRLVSDKTVGVKAPSVQAEYEKVWNKFYQEGRQMGLDDTDSKSYVRLMLGKSDKDLHFIPWLMYQTCSPRDTNSSD